MVALVDRFAPAPPRAARILGRIVGEAPYPIMRDNTTVGPPPRSDAGPSVDTGAARSVVRVDGNACGLHLAGTGFAVDHDLIMTNAHVVAGEQRTTVTTVDGRELDARVVQFNGRHDIAVLQVRGADLTPLPLGPTRIGTIASVLGHPGGGELRATPARIARRIGTPRTDIYRSGTISTSIVGLAAHLIPGDSGAPVVGSSGRVQAMVFAIDPASDTTAFALSSGEFGPFVAAARGGRPVSTGSCLND
jgi:S1-C subfamily serine protease